MTELTEQPGLVRAGTACPQNYGIEKKIWATTTMASKAQPNGTANREPTEVSSLPPVIGINFGNSYASIAVFTKVRAPSSPIHPENLSQSIGRFGGMHSQRRRRTADRFRYRVSW
jgi:hypothetical protein